MQRRTVLSRLAATTALAGGVPWWAGCAEFAPLRVAIHPWVGYETLYLARDFNWLSPSVALQPAADLSASAQALQNGTVDAACLTLDEVLRQRSQGIALTVALVFDVSAGADMVVAGPGIRRPADLAGKRIGVEQGVLGSLLLQGVLKEAGLLPSAVTVVSLEAGQQLAAWHNRTVDAVVCYEPHATLLQREGARRIFDSRQMPDTILDVLAVRSDRGDRHREALRTLVHGHFKGLAHLQANRQDAVYRIAARQNITPREVQQALAGVVLPTLEANRQYLTSPGSRLLEVARRLLHLMVQGGLLAGNDTLTGLASGVWLPADES